MMPVTWWLLVGKQLLVNGCRMTIKDQENLLSRSRMMLCVVVVYLNMQI